MKVGGKLVLPPLQKASQIRDYVLNYTELIWNQPLESFGSVANEKAGTFINSGLSCFAQTILVAPLGGVASIEHQVSMS
jgi:hypothetical protein